MDLGDQLVVIADRDFIHFESLFFHPESNVAQKDGNSLIDVGEGTPDVHISGSIFTGPFPRLRKHAPMKFPQIDLIHGIPAVHDPGTERPPLRDKNIFALPLVQLSLVRKTGNELRRIIRMKRRIPGGLVQVGNGAHFCLSRRFVSFSINSLTFPAAWFSRAMVCSTSRTSAVACARARFCASSVIVPDFGTMAYTKSQSIAAATRRRLCSVMRSFASAVSNSWIRRRDCPCLFPTSSRLKPSPSRMARSHPRCGRASCLAASNADRLRASCCNLRFLKSSFITYDLLSCYIGTSCI